MRMAGAEWVNIHGGDFEGNGLVNLDFLDMSTAYQLDRHRPRAAANFNIAVYGCHFEAYGSKSKLLQTITITGAPSAGTFTLNGQTLNWNADSTAIQAACDAAFGAGNCVVTGGPLPGAQVTLTFQGIYQFGFGPTVTIVNSITGGSYAINTVRPTGATSASRAGGASSSPAASTCRRCQTGRDADLVPGRRRRRQHRRVLNGDYILQSIFSSAAGPAGDELLRRGSSAAEPETRRSATSTGRRRSCTTTPPGDGHGGADRPPLVAGQATAAATRYSAPAGAPTWELGGVRLPGRPVLQGEDGSDAGSEREPLRGERLDRRPALLGRQQRVWSNPPRAGLSSSTPTYSASITPDASAGEWQTITVTNGTAFTINAPTSPADRGTVADAHYRGAELVRWRDGRGHLERRLRVRGRRLDEPCFNEEAVRDVQVERGELDRRAARHHRLLEHESPTNTERIV
jgi:hypothetical protein